MRVVTSRDSGKEYACKSISKFLDVGNLSPAKQARAACPIRENQELSSKFKQGCAPTAILRSRGTGHAATLPGLGPQSRAPVLAMCQALPAHRLHRQLCQSTRCALTRSVRASRLTTLAEERAARVRARARERQPRGGAQEARQVGRGGGLTARRAYSASRRTGRAPGQHKARGGRARAPARNAQRRALQARLRGCLACAHRDGGAQVPQAPTGRNVPVVLLMLTSPGPHDHLCQIMPKQHLLQQLQARAGHSACSNFRMPRPLRKRQGAQNRGHRRDRPAAGSSH